MRIQLIKWTPLKSLTKVMCLNWTLAILVMRSKLLDKAVYHLLDHRKRIRTGVRSIIQLRANKYSRLRDQTDKEPLTAITKLKERQLSRRLYSRLGRRTSQLVTVVTLKDSFKHSPHMATLLNLRTSSSLSHQLRL
jgi:hypothetical protein